MSDKNDADRMQPGTVVRLKSGGPPDDRRMRGDTNESGPRVVQPSQRSNASSRLVS